MTCLHHIREELRKKELAEQEEEKVKQALQKNHPEWLDQKLQLKFRRSTFQIDLGILVYCCRPQRVTWIRKTCNLAGSERLTFLIGHGFLKKVKAETGRIFRKKPSIAYVTTEAGREVIRRWTGFLRYYWEGVRKD